MPYIEVWVDEVPLSDEQQDAIDDLVGTAREISTRLWPKEEAIQLERAARRVSRAMGGIGRGPHPDRKGLFPADKKYQSWKTQAAGKAHA